MDTQSTETSIDSSSLLVEKEKVYLFSSKFESSGDLLKSVREFYNAIGYGISIRTSKKDKFYSLQCDRGGSYRDIKDIQDKRKRSTASRLVDCPFRIIGSKRRDGMWVFKPKHLAHNHEPSSDISGHPSFRQLSPNKVQAVKDMSRAGIPPRQILSSLRQQFPNLPANSRTIYNVKNKIKREKLGNRSEIGALFEELQQAEFFL
ncbi:PKS-NRPS hybrid synthetase cheA-like [Rutidosis leptorrhynchoides]|uniref:PKS-NRPS hybrid synthetase cheA-like n=1 Tax=Rutidosis leptorrhynchoides TaxID=125765 RepID=UPI003A9A41BF